jgi:multiple sugar transport system ATP-binding protein
MAVTTIYVTHDQTEAMTLGHRVAVLKRGVLQQVAPPQDLYDQPDNLFVAGFIGSPAMNLVQGRFVASGQPDSLDLTIGNQRLPVPDRVLRARPGLARYLDRPVAVGLRPEDLSDGASDQVPGRPRLHAVADLVEALGSDILVHFAIDADPVVTDDTRELARDAGAAGLDGVRTGPAGTEIVARFSPRSRLREGQPVQIAVDVDRVHVFDLSDGTAIW